MVSSLFYTYSFVLSRLLRLYRLLPSFCRSFLAFVSRVHAFHPLTIPGHVD